VFDHVTIRASDRNASERFYDVLLRVIGVEHARSSEHYAEAVHRGAARRGIDQLWIGADDATVDALHRRAIDAGYRDKRAPGERAIYHPGYYGAFVLDPDGNNVEIVNHNR
jgi:catechol 2,3-dioxygenase-like lactoylglutathione lyase family enzyme